MSSLRGDSNEDPGEKVRVPREFLPIRTFLLEVKGLRITEEAQAATSRPSPPPLNLSDRFCPLSLSECRLRRSPMRR